MLKLEHKGQTLIAHMDGEIDHRHVLFLRAAIDRVLDDTHVEKLIFDFSRVEFMDSSGIGLLIGRYKRMKSGGGVTLISGSNPTLDRILRLSGIDMLIRRADVPEERRA